MEGRDLVKEALADAKSLKEAAVESAKKEIVESLTPVVRRLLERSRTGNSEYEKSPEGGTRQQKKDYGPLAIAEKEEPVAEELTLEDALQEFFPAGVEEKKEMKSSEKKSSMKEMKSSKKSSAMHEEIEISEAELRKVYEAALKTEVQVKKGFGDMTNFVELDGKTPGNDKNAPPPPTGRAAGEKHWEEEKAPAEQKWIPEMKQMVAKGLAENKALRENLRKAVTMIETLGKKLHEVNLFNAKVLHVNKILNSGARLTKEQKEFVMESVDKARSISEVKMVYETIVGSLKTSAAITEARTIRPAKANASAPRTSGTPKQEVLSESVDQGKKDQYSRVKELAGLLK
jgi:hypothetical protein